MPSCMQGATVRMETPSGRSNVCLGHFLFFAQSEAAIYCEANGLETVEQMREFCRQKMRSFGRRSFDDWASTIKQDTVTLMIRTGADKALARLREGGYIDSDFKVTHGTS
jgi:hypothetical protein